MSDSAPARKGGFWPLLAISLLVLLLAAFLVVKFRKEERPHVVKEPPAPPPPPVVVVENPPVPPVPPPTPPAPVVAPDAQERLASIEKALKERRWDDAEKALEGLKDVEPLRARLAAGRKEEDDARKEAAAREEARRKRDAAWAESREKLEKAKDAYRYAEADAILDALKAAHPDLDKMDEVTAFRESLNALRKDSDALYKKEMGDADKHFAAGKYAAATTAAEKALRYYPDRAPAVRELQAKIRSAKLESEMVRIPDAQCWIGSDQNEDERPARQVKLPPFFIDRYEVTNEDYQAFVTSTGRPSPVHWGGGKSVPRGGERHPVVYVSYADAEAYAAWAGKRLPTAEEWEVAARGPDRREFPWGNSFSEKENVFPCNSLEYWQVLKAAPNTMAVDAPPLANGESAFRVFGMGGNVWEWTSTTSAGKVGQNLLEFRILKGGSFMTSSKALRCANRLAEDPRIPLPDVGFRCARDAK